MMIKIGLTGGIACGKSLATHYFRQLNITVLDSDQIARQLVKPNQPALKEITDIFGENCLNKNGSLNRTWMREKVFSNPQQLALLESILHPLIRLNLKKQIKNCNNSDTKKAYIVLDIPLLIEKSFTNLVDRILVIDCSQNQQIKRAVKRDQSRVVKIERIIQMQISRSTRLKVADDILDNRGTKNELYLQIQALHQRYLKISSL